ncbi:hypothetical protein M409DRAFT_27133 [Zasmidium cellare ATCC 36951]|uniref:SprT-like domain-containing protein n=1 Tax=Zasmidium cellare ATCC 36951 TaxID=1080233 RepID=A0A6A6CA36_ZASCE|nr:uncharacterized protein M409DRAFT_27133 [Zasmidium cellare ATCC 36951]KAF2162509.1 hypothetical protein M409DRAFT_27133 [Zasmidium cellare ATCC 36951]
MPFTDEDAALEAITQLAALSSGQEEAKAKIDSILATDDPFVDIHELFGLYNTLYFRTLLVPRVEVSWSARLTLCAGICELVRDPSNNNKYTRIRLKLSESLLKYRSRSDVVNTLLHEAIHAYFFITTSWRHSRGDDGTGHGDGFLLLADAINDHGGYSISVYHTFHDEVDSYRTHVWQCDGPCKGKAPFFGLVKRSMNRAPGKSDVWWKQHQDECGGRFEKIAEPEMSKERVERLSGLERAGRQRNKIDAWVRKRGASRGGDGKGAEADGVPAEKKMKMAVKCPVCSEEMEMSVVDEHVEREHPPGNVLK